MKTFALLVLGLSCVLLPQLSTATSLAPKSLPERVDAVDAICRGTVVGLRSFETDTGGIVTKAAIRVEEPLKGTFPAIVEVQYRGGTVGHDTLVEGGFGLVAGESRLFLLERGADGALFVPEGGAGAALLSGSGRAQASVAGGKLFLAAIRQLLQSSPQAGADVSDRSADWADTPGGGATQTLATNMLPVGGVAARFTAPDRGEPIHYLVDADAKPAGLTLDQCMTAISNAFRAWGQVTSCQFVFDGFESFGKAPANVEIDDGRIRVALHDSYGYINGSSTLGIGGRRNTFSFFAQGGEGGSVRGNDFHPTTRGYLVLKHTAASMQNAKTFEEVACHEIGHVLSMAHSSEIQGESNPVLKEAVMYFLVHDDGRGAQLGTYDVPVIQQAYPPDNTPPWNHDRFFHAVSASVTPNVAGINSVELRGYDLQGTNLALVITNQTANNGSFTVVGHVVKFTPAGNFGDSTRLTPESGASYESFYYRFTDGTNGSPWTRVKMLSFNNDSKPAGNSDGIPDNWMVQYFGNADPAVGSKHTAGDDFDGDGLTNFEEFLASTDPTSAASVLRLNATGGTVTFAANPYDLYELRSTSDVGAGFSKVTPVQPTDTSGSLPVAGGSGAQFFKLQRVP